MYKVIDWVVFEIYSINLLSNLYVTVWLYITLWSQRWGDSGMMTEYTIRSAGKKKKRTKKEKKGKNWKKSSHSQDGWRQFDGRNEK